MRSHEAPPSTSLGWAPNSSPHPCYGQAQWADLITNLGLVYQPKPKSNANRGGLKNPSQTQAQNFIFLQLASPPEYHPQRETSPSAARWREELWWRFSGNQKVQPSRWLVRVMAAGEASKRLADVVRTARRCREGQQACLDSMRAEGRLWESL